MTLSSRLAGLGHFVPEQRITSAELEDRLRLPAGWIEQRTGIRERRWARPEDTLSEMACHAADQALARSGIGKGDIGFTILATSTPDQLLPPTSPLLVHRLGLQGSGAVDLAGACTGFLSALVLADAYVRTFHKPALVVAANILSRRVNMAEPATAAVFADAAGAVVLTPTPDPGAGLLASDLTCDGGSYDEISIKGGGSTYPFYSGMPDADALIRMANGRAVFTKAVAMMSQCAEGVLAKAGVNFAQVDRFVPHQANVRIMEAIEYRLGLSAGRMVRTIAEYGNSSAATIPLSLSVSNGERAFTEGEYLLLAAAGAGMMAGAAVFRC